VGVVSNDSDAVRITSTDYDTIQMWENCLGMPMINAPATAMVQAGQPGAIGGVSISESPVTSDETFMVTLNDTNGALSVTGPGVLGSGTTSLTITGSLDQVNSDLATLTDTDDITPSDTITINASDSNGGMAMPATIAVIVNGQTATALGCPHFTTFDGLHFDFQGAGEFVAARSTQPGNTFQVQMRIEPEGSLDSAVSIITQIAVQVGSDRVTVGVPQGNKAPRPQVVWVDGAPAAISLTNPVITLDGGTVTEVSQNEYRVVLNTGEVVTVNPYGDGMGLSIALGPNDRPGSVQGFFGPAEGQANDFQLPDGTVLQQPLTQAQLYQTFANAWRVTDATSLLDYGPGQDTETFTNTMYPREILRLADFSPAMVSKAAALAAAAGITDPTLAADAEFDYLTMGDPSHFSKDATVAALSPRVPTPAVITGPVPPPPSIGVLPANPEIVEAIGATTPVTFIANLTSAATTDTVVDYAVVAPTGTASGKSFLSASDFGGTLPSGSVTISAGETEADITVGVPNSAVASAPNKWLILTVSSPDGNLVYDPAGQVEIVNSQPVPGAPAQPVIELLSNPASAASGTPETLTVTGNNYTVNLGQVLENAALPPLQFAIVNMAMPGADNLSSQISGITGTGFAVFGTQLPATIAAGNAFQGLYFQPETSAPGAQTETLTLTSKNVNDTGYSAALPDITLTVGDTVVAPTGPVLGGGGNTVFWTEGNTPTVIDPGLTVTNASSTTLTGATVTIISGFLAGDQLDFTNQNNITGSYNAATGVLTLSGSSSVANYQATLDSVSYSSTSSSPSAAGADSVRTISWQVSNGATSSNTVASTIDVGEIYHLTTGLDTIHAGAGNDIIIATTGTLGAGDVIDGGSGTNTLGLVGAGTFNLATPATLADIQVITAQKGQAAYAADGTTYPAQNQIVTLRNGLDATLNVSADAAINAGNPKAPTITIIGAQNAAVINLASGNDTVEVGDPRETVNLGSGNDTILVTGATIGATIQNGTGVNTLEVTGGGTMAMGGNISDIANVLLASAATAYDFTANAISGLTVDDLDTVLDTVQAGGANQTLTGGGAGQLTMVGSSAGNDTFRNPSTLFNGDSIQGFGRNGDVIDLSDLSLTGVGLTFTENAAGTAGTLNVIDGMHSAAIALFGQYAAAGFQTAPDSGGLGTAITYQDPAQMAALATPLHHA
jgi:hypothetical protein